MLASHIQAPTRPEGFRFTLRRATRPEHEALDAHPAFAALMDGTLTIEGYRRLMSLFHAFYARHDTMLGEACRHFAIDRLGFSYASRAGILADDLSALGGAASRPDQTEPAALPPIESVGALAGFLYVFEGSMLGGALLCRAAEAVLAPTGLAGHGYWRWCRDAGGKRWAMTCHMLDRLASTAPADTEMIDASKAAFVTFSQWLACWQDDRRADAPTMQSVPQC